MSQDLQSRPALVQFNRKSLRLLLTISLISHVLLYPECNNYRLMWHLDEPMLRMFELVYCHVKSNMMTINIFWFPCVLVKFNLTDYYHDLVRILDHFRLVIVHCLLNTTVRYSQSQNIAGVYITKTTLWSNMFLYYVISRWPSGVTLLNTNSAWNAYFKLSPEISYD